MTIPNSCATLKSATATRPRRTGIKKLKDELDAKEHKLDAGGAEASGTESTGDAHGPGEAGTQGTDEVK